jgi:hypothetical protein
MDREGKKDAILNQSVKKFSKSFVLTLSPGNKMSDGLDLILEKKIGSVVIIDNARHPVGIITTRDFFDLMMQPSAKIQFSSFNRNLSRSSKRVVRSFMRPLMHFLETKKNVSEARLSVKEEKNGNLFKVIFSLFTKKGKKQVISKEGNDLEVVLHEVKEGIRNVEGKRKLTS